MSCGCENTCGCLLTSPDGTIDVLQIGDEFQLSHLDFVRAIVDTSCIDLNVDVDGNLTAAPIIDPDSASVALACGPDGLLGDVRIDPTSSAPVTITADGLKIDCCAPPPNEGSVPPGVIDDFVGWVPPVGWLEAFGQSVQVVNYPNLYDALTLVTETGTVTSLSPVIGGLPTTIGMAPGMTVEALGFGGYSTIVSIDSPTQITVDIPAVTSWTNTATVRVFSEGLSGSGASWFVIPDMRDVVSAGLGNMGGSDRDIDGITALTSDAAVTLSAIFGESDVQIGVSNLPPHDHGISGSVTASGSGDDASVSIAADGSHGHGVPDNPNFTQTDKSRDFVVVGNGDPTDHPLTQASVDNASVGTARSIPVGPSEFGGVLYAQGTSQFTKTVANHTHAGSSVDDAEIAAAISISSSLAVVDTQASSAPFANDAFNNLQPTKFVRKIIKT